MIVRKSGAVWKGSTKDGKGVIEVGSAGLKLDFSFGSRFESARGTNPEELLGAAHAGCFSMALANSLALAGHVATSIKTTAVVSANKTDAGFAITNIALTTRGVVPGISADTFQKFAEETKTGCIISRALSAVPMTLDAKLEG